MSYIMLPGMGSLGGFLSEESKKKALDKLKKEMSMLKMRIGRKSKRGGLNFQAVSDQKKLDKLQAQYDRMKNEPVQAATPALPAPSASRDEGDWRQKSQKAPLTDEQQALRAKLPGKFKPTQSGNAASWSNRLQSQGTDTQAETFPSGVDVTLPQNRSMEATTQQAPSGQAPTDQEVDLMQSQEEAPYTPPAQITDPGASQWAGDMATNQTKPGIDKKLLIGGGLAAAGLVAVFLLAD